MRSLLLCALLCLLVASCASLKILHFIPGFGGSHLLFSYRLAKALTSRGHNITLVTLYAPPFNNQSDKFNAPAGVTEFKHLPKWIGFDVDFMSVFQDHAFKEIKFPDIVRFGRALTDELASTCDQLLNDHHFINKLRQNGPYDIGLVHYFDPCPVGVLRLLDVHSQFMFSAGAFIIDPAAQALHISSNPSYIPNSMGTSSDQMSFMHRLENGMAISIGRILGQLSMSLLPRLAKSYEQVSLDGRNLVDLWAETPGIFVNGEKFLDFGRPFPFGSLHLGALSQSPANVSKSQQLDSDWLQILDSSDKGTILFSLGTIANTSKMPEFMKEAFFQAFTRFPEYRIIWRYEGAPMATINYYPNIYVSKWVPQSQILHHESTRLFITHGGYNSLVESTEAGVPMLMLPLFGDQMTNAVRGQRHGLGLVLDKMTVTGDTVATAMAEVLGNERYRQNAVHFSSFMQDRIGSSLDLVEYHLKHQVSNTWYAHYHDARKRLTFIQAKSLDVVFVSLALTMLTVFSTYKIICHILRAKRTTTSRVPQGGKNPRDNKDDQGNNRPPNRNISYANEAARQQENSLKLVLCYDDGNLAIRDCYIAHVDEAILQAVLALDRIENTDNVKCEKFGRTARNFLLLTAFNTRAKEWIKSIDLGTVEGKRLVFVDYGMAPLPVAGKFTIAGNPVYGDKWDELVKCLRRFNNWAEKATLLAQEENENGTLTYFILMPKDVRKELDKISWRIYLGTRSYAVQRIEWEEAMAKIPVPPGLPAPAAPEGGGGGV